MTNSRVFIMGELCDNVREQRQPREPHGVNDRTVHDY